MWLEKCRRALQCILRITVHSINLIFKRQSHKMVKHTQTNNCLSVFDHFVILALKGLKVKGKKEPIPLLISSTLLRTPPSCTTFVVLHFFKFGECPSTFQPISSQCCISITYENIRKP